MEYVLAASTTERLAALRDVPPGETLQIIVQAVNGRSQGVASDPITFKMPVAKAAGFRNLSTTEEEPKVSENSNGHGNGNGNGRHARVA